MFIGNAIAIGAGRKFGSIPKQLGAVVHIEDFTTPVNGYWVDKSGKNKQIQAATTTTLNDSLIMPANDADIIAAVTMSGYYSKFYTTNSTPKTVLLSQIPSIDSKYSFFYDAKNKTKLTLFKTQGDEARADKMYEYTFKAYTGGYFPITQTSDSISFVIRGTGTHVFDWGDGTTTSYTLTTGVDTTVSHTWSTNLGGQKNISVIGAVKNWTRFDQINRTNDNEIIRLTYLNLLFLRIGSSPNIVAIGDISYSYSLLLVQLSSMNNCRVSGDISNKPLTFLALISCPLINISGNISSMSSMTTLQLISCQLINIYVNISSMSSMTTLQLNSCPLISSSGNIEIIPSNAVIINITISGITYGGGATNAWNISQTIQAGWSSSMLDAWFNAYSLTVPTVTAKTLNFAGTNQAPTSASLAARNNIISKGFIIIINS